MRTAWLLLVLSAAPSSKGPPAASKASTVDAPKAQSAALTPEASGPKLGDTACVACHVTGSWNEVRFNHDRTGFPLKGGHATTGCKECHAVDFKKPVPRGCAGCHLDVHAGDLGQRCEGCHDESTWRSRIDVDAHRRTAFPLVGGHAIIPCGECHLDSASRRFSRATVECGHCHQNDYDRTRTQPVNHAVLGFDQAECRGCHGAFAFRPARFPTHDACFAINIGGHVGMPCTGCHKSFPSASGSLVDSCQKADTAVCVSCHEHTCTGPNGTTKTDQLHMNLWGMGYACADAKCAQCHETMPK